MVCLSLASPNPPIFFVAMMRCLLTKVDLGREQDIKASRKRDQEHEDRQEERANRRVQAKAVGSQDDDKGVGLGSPWSFETAMPINLLLSSTVGCKLHTVKIGSWCQGRFDSIDL